MRRLGCTAEEQCGSRFFFFFCRCREETSVRFSIFSCEETSDQCRCCEETGRLCREETGRLCCEETDRLCCEETGRRGEEEDLFRFILSTVLL